MTDISSSEKGALTCASPSESTPQHPPVYCGASSPDGIGYRCTEQRGHEGEHVAGSFARWSASSIPVPTSSTETEAQKCHLCNGEGIVGGDPCSRCHETPTDCLHTRYEKVCTWCQKNLGVATTPGKVWCVCPNCATGFFQNPFAPAIPSTSNPELEAIFNEHKDAGGRLYGTANAPLRALFSSLSSELSRVELENEALHNERDTVAQEFGVDLDFDLGMHARVIMHCQDEMGAELKRLRETALTQEEAAYLLAWTEKRMPNVKNLDEQYALHTSCLEKLRLRSSVPTREDGQ